MQIVPPGLLRIDLKHNIGWLDVTVKHRLAQLWDERMLYLHISAHIMTVTLIATTLSFARSSP